MSFPAYTSHRASGVHWLGHIPAHWDGKKFRWLFRESPEKITDTVVGPMLSVSGYRGIKIKEYDDENRRRLDEELVGYRIVREGQLVVNTMWLNYAGLGVSDHEGHVSPAYRSYWISEDLNRRYIHHLMRSELYVRAYTRLLTGIRPNSLQMSRDDLMDFPVLIPPLPEQTAIAAFLDRETGKSDALVAGQRRLIALLKEKRQAVISHAVTKGLNPDAPMKPTGIEWLGDVPGHWDLKQLKHLILPGTAITYGIVQAGPHYEGGVPYIRTSDMSGDTLPLSGYPLTSPEIDQSYTRSKLLKGDIVVAIRATVGKCLPVPDELVGANLTQGTAKISPGNSVYGDFLLAALSGAETQSYFDRVSKGATFKEITLDALRRTPVAVPPRNEQEEMADFLVEQTVALDALTHQAETAITLLQERRSALISAAVTGKIDVRGLAPAETEAA